MKANTILYSPLSFSTKPFWFFSVYRTCLRYFLPPNWIMDKESVSTLTVQELAAFSLDDFFDHYEKGLRKVIYEFQCSFTNSIEVPFQTADLNLCHISIVLKYFLKYFFPSSCHFSRKSDFFYKPIYYFIGKLPLQKLGLISLAYLRLFLGLNLTQSDSWLR